MFLSHWTIDNDLIFMGWPGPAAVHPLAWPGELEALCVVHLELVDQLCLAVQLSAG